MTCNNCARICSLLRSSLRYDTQKKPTGQCYEKSFLDGVGLVHVAFDRNSRKYSFLHGGQPRDSADRVWSEFESNPRFSYGWSPGHCQLLKLNERHSAVRRNVRRELRTSDRRYTLWRGRDLDFGSDVEYRVGFKRQLSGDHRVELLDTHEYVYYDRNLVDQSGRRAG